MLGVSLTHPVLALFYSGGFSYTSRAGFIFYFFIFYFQFPCKSRAGFIFCGHFFLHVPGCLILFLIWGISLSHPMLASFFCREFLLHIPCWLHFYLGSFSYTSHNGFIFIWPVSLTHPMLALFFCGEFLLHIPCWLLFLI